MSIKEMSTRERIISAIKNEPVDYVPMTVDFKNPYARESDDIPPHPKTVWKNEEERLAAYRDWGWDTYLTIVAAVSPLPDVQTAREYGKDREGDFLLQTWKTKAGTITEKLRLTDDWTEAYNRTENIPFGSDFRTSRYIEYPFKDSSSLAALQYLFPENNALDEDAIRAEYREKRALADNYQVPLFAYIDAGMDWLMWLFPAEEVVLKMMDEPEALTELLSTVNRAKQKRLKLLLELGVDGVMRRGWYESADLWSPGIFREYAAPAINLEVKMTHAVGSVYSYIMNTGIMPIINDLSAIGFDCLAGPIPVSGSQDLAVIKKALPGKCIWGGISAHEQLQMCRQEDAEKAVDSAFASIGKKGFILSPTSIFRRTWPWENLMAFEKAWRKNR